MLLAGFSRGHVTGTLENAADEFSSRQVLKRTAAPREIAEAVWFLANAKHSSFITGAVLFADGGATSKLSGE
jgi:NAD(P)-dependent dehydrogenase (short-subunit alcohol dehydrogenase family)